MNVGVVFLSKELKLEFQKEFKIKVLNPKSTDLKGLDFIIIGEVNPPMSLIPFKSLINQSKNMNYSIDHEIIRHTIVPSAKRSNIPIIFIGKSCIYGLAELGIKYQYEFKLKRIETIRDSYTDKINIYPIMFKDKIHVEDRIVGEETWFRDNSSNPVVYSIENFIFLHCSLNKKNEFLINFLKRKINVWKKETKVKDWIRN